jgi:hypothetical protein
MLAAPPVPLADSDDDDDNDERRKLHQEILEWMERKDSDNVRFAHSDGKLHFGLTVAPCSRAKNNGKMYIQCIVAK